MFYPDFTHKKKKKGHLSEKGCTSMISMCTTIGSLIISFKFMSVKIRLLLVINIF